MASTIPARAWIPHGANGPVSGVIAPSLIGLAVAALPLDPANALAPLKAAVTRRPPTTAATLYRFTTSSFRHAALRSGRRRRGVLVPNRSIRCPDPTPFAIEVADDALAPVVV
jgi:hypothetical protein